MRIHTDSGFIRRSVIAAAAASMATIAIATMAMPAGAATETVVGHWTNAEHTFRHLSSVDLTADGDSYKAVVKVWCGEAPPQRQCNENGTGTVAVEYKTANQPKSGVKRIAVYYPDLHKTIVLTPKGSNQFAYTREAQRNDGTVNKTSGTLTRAS